MTKSGFLLVDKKKNMTSYDVIREIKKQNKNIKIGHTGTLDPNTTGLMVLGINKATKLFPIITHNSQKTYIAQMKFGIKTDTGDITGKIISENEIKVNEKNYKKIFNSFIKTYEQVPPNYSAKKINGERAYDLARNNKEFKLDSKKVTIFDLIILRTSPNTIEFEATVSKGTYIRTLIEDIAQSLGTIATMTELRRTKTDGFELKEEFIELEEYLKNKYETFELDDKFFNLIKNGAKINDSILLNELKTDDVLFLKNNKMVALYTKKENGYVSLINLWENNETL